jgi:hypothetical protein
MEVPLTAAFGGVAWLPWLALGHNSANPLLVLKGDELEYRLFARTRRPYSDVVSADYRHTLGTRNVILRFRGTSRTFTANVRDDAAVRATFAFLRDKGVPLTSRAEACLTVG